MTNLDPAIRTFLEERRFAVLGTLNEDGSIQQTVMWYTLRDGHMMMNTKRDRVKDRNLLRDPRVSVCIEDETRFITISGRVALDDDPATAQADIRALAVRYDGEAAADEQVRDAFAHQERITLRLPLERVITHGF